MSATETVAATSAAPRAARSTAALVGSGLSLAFLVASIWHYADDARRRGDIDKFVRTYHVAERRPAHAETIGYAPAADLGAEIAADVALQDTTGAVKLSDVDPATRELWIEAVSHFNQELDSARLLLLNALHDRPGYAYHRALLGEIEYMRARRAMRLRDHPERWLLPLEAGMHFAPGDLSLPEFAGAAMVDSWPFLQAGARRDAPRIFSLAFLDPQFVSVYYPAILNLLGHPATFALLPHFAPSVAQAIKAESDEGDVRAVSELYPRWEGAEWTARIRDLGAIAERQRLNDLSGLDRECRLWASRHAPGDFDTPAGRNQVLRVLDMWPSLPGSWLSDPRADYVRFFLNGRLDRAANFVPHPAGTAEQRAAEKSLEDSAGDVIARVVPLLSDVPRPIAARAALFGNDVSAAEGIARGAETAGGFEWTRFYVDLAYSYLGTKRPLDAAAALSQISPTARDECDVAVARTAVARAGGGNPPAEEALFPVSYPAVDWAKQRVQLCVDPFRGDHLLSAVVTLPQNPAFVIFGFDDGRTTYRLIPPGRAELLLPLESRAGRHVFGYRVVTGGPVEPESASVQ